MPVTLSMPVELQCTQLSFVYMLKSSQLGFNIQDVQLTALQVNERLLLSGAMQRIKSSDSNWFEAAGVEASVVYTGNMRKFEDLSVRVVHAITVQANRQEVFDHLASAVKELNDGNPELDQQLGRPWQLPRARIDPLQVILSVSNVSLAKGVVGVGVKALTFDRKLLNFTAFGEDSLFFLKGLSGRVCGVFKEHLPTVTKGFSGVASGVGQVGVDVATGVSQVVTPVTTGVGVSGIGDGVQMGFGALGSGMDKVGLGIAGDGLRGVGKVSNTAVSAVGAGVGLVTGGVAVYQSRGRSMLSRGRAGKADVTWRVRDLVRGGRLDIIVSNEILGGDPCPGHSKELRIVYSGGKQHVIRENEACSLVL
eukprot:g2789.t1